MTLLNHYVIALASTSITTFLLGIFVYFRDKKRKINWRFALYSISIAVWSGGEAIAATISDKNTALLLWRLNHIGVIFIGILFLHFVFVLLDIREKKRRVILYIGYIFSFIFLISDFSNLLISEVLPQFSFKSLI